MTHTRTRTLLHLGIAVCLCVAVSPSCKQATLPELADLGVVPHWTMTAENGAPIGSAQLRGKVWVANFLFTSCPTSCPPLAKATAELQQQLRALGPAGRPPAAQIVSFSVDPENDTPEVLTAFARKYGADPQIWHFATSGNYDVTERLVTEGFLLPLVRPGGPVAPLPGGETPTAFDTAHSLRFVVVDGRGHIRGTWDKDPQGIAHTIAAVRYLSDL